MHRSWCYLNYSCFDARHHSSSLVFLTLPQHITKLFQRTSRELVLFPQVGCQETVCVSDSNECSLQGVLERLCATGRGTVRILHTSKLEQTLDSRRCDDASTSRSWNESDCDGTTLSTLFRWQAVRLSKVGTPVPSSDW